MKRRNFLKGIILGTGLTLINPTTLTDLVDTPLSNPSPQFIWNPEYSFKWMEKFPYNKIAESHISPVKKFEQLYNDLIQKEVTEKKDFSQSTPLTEQDFLAIHSSNYLQKLEHLAQSLSGLFNGENPINKQILAFAKTSCAGTYQAAKAALETGKGMNLSGGFHHAFPGHEEGFCYLNDIAITIKKLQKEGKIKKAMIVDCDVHHGNGSAHIFEQDPSVFTFDLYQSDNYPYEKIKTDVAIALDSREYIDDSRYLEELKKTLEPAIELFQPDLIFYLNGADPLETDLLGGFFLTHGGMKERDHHVLSLTEKLGIPTAVVLAGGYSPKIEDVVKVHYNCAKLIKN
ncbi:histone deacetylase [Candidatus Woesearchaeota archaeon]|jgi:acetoin utilization deacetylase AcuC-like enzyme|nr:histone deacetylase [Candidatus Woesearchaeota archaeon]